MDEGGKFGAAKSVLSGQLGTYVRAFLEFFCEGSSFPAVGLLAGLGSMQQSPHRVDPREHIAGGTRSSRG